MADPERKSWLHETFDKGIIVGVLGIVMGAVSNSVRLFQIGLGVVAGSAVGSALTK